MPDAAAIDDDRALLLKTQCVKLMGFTDLFWPVIEPDRELVKGWHLGCISEHLEWVSQPDCDGPNLIINIPPRCMKSLQTCVFWFAWEWTYRPATRWMFSSYADDLVQRDSQRCRDIVRHPLYQRLWDVRIKNDQDTQKRFTNQYQGFRYAVTVAGKGMGEGADRIVVDDPINPRRARSAAERAKVIHWWRSTMNMRSNDPLSVRKVIIMQRLHERDLTGYLMAESLGWNHLVLPMRYEPRRYFLPDMKIVGGDGAALIGGPGGGYTASGERGSSGLIVPQLTIPQAAVPQPGQAGADLESAKAALAALVADLMEVKKPRDAITPTPLQLRRPDLMDGPTGSGRQDEGDLLWADRFPDKIVTEMEHDLADEAPGQLYQRPTGEAGDIFKKESFRQFVPLWSTEDGMAVKFAGVRLKGPDPSMLRDFTLDRLTWFQTIDTALTESSRSAYTVVGTFALTSEFDLVIWDMFRARLLVPEQLGVLMELRAGPCLWVKKTRKLVRTGTWPANLVFQAVEPKASGPGLIQQAAAEGKPFHILKVDGDKIMRSGPVATMYHNGKVYHPEQVRPWVVSMEEELLSFPNGTFKDQADVVSYGGYLAVHDKILRSFSNRPVADVPPEGTSEEPPPPREGEVEFQTPFGPVRVDFGDDSDPYGFGYNR